MDKSNSVSDFFIVPNEEKKSLTIMPGTEKEFVEISKDKALIFISIIQDLIRKW